MRDRKQVCQPHSSDPGAQAPAGGPLAEGCVQAAGGLRGTVKNTLSENWTLICTSFLSIFELKGWVSVNGFSNLPAQSSF